MQWKRYLARGLICALMGFTMVLQARTLTLKGALAMKQSQSTDQIVTQLLQVGKERDRLQEELRVLRDMVTQETTRSRLQEQVLQQRAASGLMAVRGRGIIVSLTVARPTDPDLLKDILWVMNELKASGAEALAIGSVRLTERTRIVMEKDGVTVNGEPVRGQVVISAVGDPAVLEPGVTMRGGVLDVLRNYYQISVMEAAEIVAPPAGSDDAGYDYARATR